MCVLSWFWRRVWHWMEGWRGSTEAVLPTFWRSTDLVWTDRPYMRTPLSWWYGQSKILNIRPVWLSKQCLIRIWDCGRVAFWGRNRKLRVRSEGLDECGFQRAGFPWFRLLQPFSSCSGSRWHDQSRLKTRHTAKVHLVEVIQKEEGMSYNTSQYKVYQPWAARSKKPDGILPTLCDCLLRIELLASEEYHISRSSSWPSAYTWTPGDMLYTVNITFLLSLYTDAYRPIRIRPKKRVGLELHTSTAT